MTDRKEYIERGTVLGYLAPHADNEDDLQPVVVMEFVESIPAADVVEVVRCSECRHLRVFNEYDIYAMCARTGRIFLPFKKDTRKHFCSDGERKDGADNAAD